MASNLKYRPAKLEEIVGQPIALRVMRRVIENAVSGISVQHVILVGPPGVGKSSAAEAMAKEIVDRRILADYWSKGEPAFVRYNAADANGVEFARDFPRRVGTGGFVVYLFEEADRITPEAWSIFRTVFEAGSKSLFVIVSNKEIDDDAILSRCVRIEFSPLSVSALEAIGQRIAAIDGVDPDSIDMKAAAHAAKGDGRAMIKAVTLGGLTVRARERSTPTSLSGGRPRRREFDVDEAVRLHEMGEGWKTIARKLDAAESTIRRAVRARLKGSAPL